MTYRLLFREDAWEEWGKPGSTVRKQFKRKLAERLELPHVPSARLHGSVSATPIASCHF